MTGGTCIKLLEQAGLEFGGITASKVTSPTQAPETTRTSGLDPIHDDYGFVGA